MIFGNEWQTIALYGGLLFLVCVLLWRWHTNPIYANFSLLHAITNREGFYDPDRAHLTGSFIVCTFAVVVSVIRNAVTLDVAALVGGYASVFALKSAWNFAVSRRTEADVRTAEIKRGRRDDPEETVEEEDAKKERRGSLLK